MADPGRRAANAMPCQNPKCRKKIERWSTSGRPRKYCSDRCRRDAYRKIHAAPEDEERHNDEMQQIAQGLVERAVAVRAQAQHSCHSSDDREAQTFDLLRSVQLLAEEVEDLRTAAVQQARDRGIKSTQIAPIWGLHPSKIRRDWPLGCHDRRMARRTERLEQTAALPQDPSLALLTPDENDPRNTKALPDLSVSDLDLKEPPKQGVAHHEFTQAISVLQRSSGKSLSHVGQEIGVSRSYISRILAGERCPSWDVSSRLIAACGGHPADLQDLWMAAYADAHGSFTSTSALLATLRALQAAADRTLHNPPPTVSYPLLTAHSPHPPFLTTGRHESHSPQGSSGGWGGMRLGPPAESFG